MDEEAHRLKKDLQTVENALGLNLWTRRDVRRGLAGVFTGGAAGLFLVVWSACHGTPVAGLLVFIAVLAAILIGKDIGFRRQPAPAPGSGREIGFYNRFYVVGGSLVGGVYIWRQARGMDPMTGFAVAVIMAGAWYLFYAISAPSRWVSLGGAIPLIACGFLLADARDFSDALFRLGLAMCAGCCAEGILLLIALRPPPALPSESAAGGAKPVPIDPHPAPPLADAAH